MSFDQGKKDQPGDRFRLRFAPALEILFRESQRKRMRVPRSALFFALASLFLLSPFYQDALFAPEPHLAALFRWTNCLLFAPACLLAGTATWLRSARRSTRVAQVAAIVLSLSAGTAWRYLALTGHMSFPTELTGLAIIAASALGGFWWPWIAALAAVFLGGGGLLEWRLAPADVAGGHVFTLAVIGVIAVCGAVTQNLVLRWLWWDLTRLRGTRSALLDTEARFHAFLEHTPSIAWIKDDQGRYVMRNKAHRDRYGESGEDWTGRHDSEFFSAADATVYDATDQEVVRTGQPAQFETANRDRNNRLTEWWIQKFPIKDSSGRTLIAGVGVDVTERKRLERELRESETRLQAFLDHNPAISWMKDAEGRYQYMSASYRKFLGLGDEGWRGRTDFDFYPAEFAQCCRDIELQVLASGLPHSTEGRAPLTGAVDNHWLLTRFVLIDSEGRPCLGGVATDVTSRKRAEDLVRAQALTDELTGLYNRRGFRLLAEQQLKLASRAHGESAFFYVDVDGLKAINELHGHQGGDLAITMVADALRRGLRSGDIIARIGGDEFVVMAIDCGDTQALGDRLNAQVEVCNLSGTLPFRLAVSIGVAAFRGGDVPTVDALMHRADAGMYEHKRTKRLQPLGEKADS